ncbi:MAG: class I SAM-dependent methyltransferase [Bacteroidota bacterium]
MLHQIANTDIYLLDQLLKGRITPDQKILDAGCGVGRNSEYFVRHNYAVFGIDINEQAIQYAKEQIVLWNQHFDLERFRVADLTEIPFPDNDFDFIISSAVLHFSEDRAHFTKLFEELVRVLKPGGILFIRMTTKHTLAHLSQHLKDDVYQIPDGSTRYLLDVDYLKELMHKHKLSFAEPFKTVNVDDVRTMAVVVLRKEK